MRQFILLLWFVAKAELEKCEEDDVTLLQSKVGLQNDDGLDADRSRPSMVEDSLCAQQPELHRSTLEAISSPSCGSCPKTGSKTESGGCCGKSGQKDWGESNMFQIFNAIYDKGALWLAGKTGLDSKLSQCYSECAVSWFEFRGYPFSQPQSNGDAVQMLAAPDSMGPLWREGLPSHAKMLPDSMLSVGSRQSNGESSLECHAGSWKEAAVVVSRYFQTNFYHNVIDTLFTTFLTASHLSMELGCAADAIDISFVDIGWADGKSPYDMLWEATFGAPIKLLSDMHGCYRRVLYGSMFYQRFLKWPGQAFDNALKVWRSPVMMPWVMAFSQNLRTNFSKSMAVSSSMPRVLLVHHKRLPVQLWNFSWDSLTGASIQREHMAKLKLAEQIKLVLKSDGIFSAMGAGFVHQVFLPTYSVLLEFGIPSEDQSTCAQTPEMWHDNVALHLGHTMVSWRICDLDMEALDLKQDLQALLSLLMARRQAAKQKKIASLCFLLKPRQISAPGWPVCEKEVSMPIQCESELPTCGKWKVGSPIRNDSNWTLVNVAA